MLHHLLKSRKTPIVHVRRSTFDVSQRWRLKQAGLAGVERHIRHAHVGDASRAVEPVVLLLLIGKDYALSWRQMTDGAAIEKKLLAAIFRRGEIGKVLLDCARTDQSLIVFRA